MSEDSGRDRVNLPRRGGVIAKYQELAHVGVQLAVTVGLIEASMSSGDGWPEEVKENFREKADQAVEQLEGLIREFLVFGEAYDEVD